MRTARAPDVTTTSRKRVVVFIVPGQPRGNLIEAQLGNDRYAVECLLTVHRNVVSQRLDGLAREGLVDAFGLLQAGHVRLTFLKPGQDIVEPLLDRIDVPGRYSHCTLPASSDLASVSWYRCRRSGRATFALTNIV